MPLLDPGRVVPPPSAIIVDQASLLIVCGIIACVAITAIAGLVVVVLGLRALSAARAEDIPVTVDTLLKGAGVFARFLPHTRRQVSPGGLTPGSAPQGDTAAQEPTDRESGAL